MRAPFVVGLVALGLGAPLVGTMLARKASRAEVAERRAVTAPPKVITKPDEELVGVLLSDKMENLSPSADGHLVEIHVVLGQSVKKGAPIASFDPRERRQQLAMAEAELASARADAAAAGAELAAARRRASRRSATVSVGGERVSLVSGEEVAQAQTEVRTSGAKAAGASAHIAEQAAKVKQLKLALEDSDLRAPFDGVVTLLNYGTGAHVHTGEIVARVVGGGKGLRVRIAVPEERAELVQALRARLTVDNTRTFFATLESYTTEVDPATRALVVDGFVENTPASCSGDCSLLAGRAVRATMLTE